MKNRSDLDIRIILSSLIFFLLIFLLSIIGSFSNLRNTIITLFENQYIDINTKVRNLSSIAEVFNNFSEVKGENEELRETVAELEEEIARLEKQLDDVSFVFESGLVDFDSDYRTIAARVLSYEPSRSGIAYINKGTNQEIEADDVVVIGEYVIGRVEDVYDNYSSIRIIGDSNLEVNVKTLTGDTRGILRRDINGNFEVRDIANDAPISEGDLFVTEGNDGLFPYGMYVGKVERVIGSPADPTKTAVIGKNLDYFDLNRVYIIKLR